jgi:hypothetical protein
MAVKRRKTGRAGAVFTIDLVAALFFFMVILLSLSWLWAQTSRHMNEYRQTSARQTRLLSISTMLITTQGNPPDWQNREVTPENTRALGLVSEDNVLDRSKLVALDGAGYQNLREIMGLGSEDFEITVSGNFNGAPTVYFDKGKSPQTGERMIVRRYALYNGTLVELKIQAYYNKTG